MSHYTQARITITTADGFPLAASRFEPPIGTLPHAAALIGCATGVYAQFYNGFAASVHFLFTVVFLQSN